MFAWLLADIIKSEHSVNGGEGLDIDDVLLFPNLVNLTIVKGLQLPDKVKNYAEALSKITHVDLFYNVAN